MERWTIAGLLLVLSLGCQTKKKAPGSSPEPESFRPGEPMKEQRRVKPRQGLGIPPSRVKSRKNPKELIAACIEWKGGLDNLKAVKTGRAVHVTKGKLIESRRRVTFQFPDKLLVEDFSGGKVSHILVLDGDRGYYRKAGKKETKTLDTEMVKSLKQSLHSDPIPALVAASAQGARLSYRGETQVSGRVVDEVSVVCASNTVHMYIAPDSGELVAYSHLTRLGPTVVLHSDYRVVSGVKMAHTNTIRLSGGMMVSRVEKIEVNIELPAGTFDPEKYSF